MDVLIIPRGFYARVYVMPAMKRKKLYIYRLFSREEFPFREKESVSFFFQPSFVTAFVQDLLVHPYVKAYIHDTLSP